MAHVCDLSGQHYLVLGLQVAPVVKTAVDAATPVVQAGVKVAGDVAAPAFKAVEPSVKVQRGPRWGWGQLGCVRVSWDGATA